MSKYILWLKVTPKLVPVEIETDAIVPAHIESDGTDFRTPFAQEIRNALNKHFGDRNEWSYYELYGVESAIENAEEND